MHKCAVNLALFVSFFAFSSSYAQTAGLKGRVVDKDNKPVQGAQVQLIKANKTQTTDQDGRFFISIPETNVLLTNPASKIVSFRDGVLSFTVSDEQKPIHIEVFDTKGQRLGSAVNEVAVKGTFSRKILPDALPVAMYFVRLQIGDRPGVFGIMNVKNRSYTLSRKGEFLERTVLNQTVASSACIDSLKISKSGYETSSLCIRSYSSDLADLQLKSDNSTFVLPPVTNGKTARTTRYWDCCKPHCAWRTSMRMCGKDGKALDNNSGESGCTGGPVYQCWDYAPIEINDNVSYGWAAFNNQGAQCGDCYQLEFQGALKGKQMIVQFINIGDGGTDAFDLMIPGGGVGALNGCSNQWNNAPLGVKYGGFHATCGDNKDCITGMCQKAFGDKPDLMRGCNWYVGWFKMANNPGVTYMKVACPKEIKDISKIGN